MAGFSVVNAATTDYANSCSSYYVVGGPGVLGSLGSIKKSYTGLQAHFKARITFFFLKIDDWNNNQVIVTADTISIPTNLFFSSSDDSSIMKLCGTATHTEAVRPVDLVFSHSNSNLDLEITTDLAVPASSASWGIYDLTVLLDICNTLFCITCSGPTASDCLSCISGFFLQNIPGPSNCESTCPDGFYSDTATKTCLPCGSDCIKCSGPSSNECLSCPSGTYLLIANGAGTCTNQCPTTHFTSLDEGICQSCDSTCKSCNGGTTKHCLSCDLPKYLLGNQCFNQCPDIYFGDNSTAKCVEECPEQTFPYNISKICCPCNGCKSCDGFGENECTSCNSVQFLEGSSCVSSCSQGYILNVQNASCDGNI